MPNRTWMLGVAVVFLALASLALAGSALSGPEDATPRWMLGADVGTKILGAGRQHTLTIDRLDGEHLRLHGPKPQAAPPSPGEGLAAFEGLSTWIDTYDTDLTPAQQVDLAAANGVQAIYLQVSRESTNGALHDHDRLAEVIELAHDADIRVMVWTIPAFEDPELDLARAKAAMAFVTPRGDRPDAFGLDIEVDDLADVALRTERVLELSAELRAWVGPDYPMAAVVLPPMQLEVNTTWWPGFPYAALAEHYDVFVPMSYSSYRGTDTVITHQWNHDNVVRLRQLVGDPDLPVHLAGGIADRLPEVATFVQAAQDTGVIGAGLYDLHTTPPAAWTALQALRTDG